MHECLLCNRDMKTSKDTFGNIIIFLLIIVGLILYTNDMQMNECLEMRVPKLTKRDITGLQDVDLFNDEEVIKIYLSKSQAKNMPKKMEKNDNWKKAKIIKIN